MVQRQRFPQFVCATVVLICMAGLSMAAENPPPAGQVCPEGSYVTGFDAEANIICSGIQSVSTDVAASVDPEQSEVETRAKPVRSQGGGREMAVKSSPATPVSEPSGDELTISKVDPRSVVYRTREVAITVTGTGFHAGTVIMFEGKTYSPRLNQAGTQLVVNIPARDLSIGPYPIMVSNGSGATATQRRAFEVY
jgi:hypothetical protein